MHISKIKSINFSDGRELKGRKIRQLSKSNMLPLMTAAEIAGNDSISHLIPLSDIKALKVPGGSYYGFIGGVIGLAIDGTIIYFMAKGVVDMVSWGGLGSGSY